MWRTKKSSNGHSMGVLRSWQQKACRRGLVDHAMQVSLEIVDSGFPWPALQYLKTICVEDKFPAGQHLLRDILGVEKEIKTLSYVDASKTVAFWAKNVALLPSDRHCCWLAKVAMYNASTGVKPQSPEIELAVEVESILLKIRRKREEPTAEDIDEKVGFAKIKEILERTVVFTEQDKCLWDLFTKQWKTLEKLTCRLFLYTIVANRFHKSNKITHEVLCAIYEEDLNRKNLQIPDFVYDKHTLEGKKRKRGLSHFLSVGAHIENPAEGIEKRQYVEAIAKDIYMLEEKRYGTQNAKSNNCRERARRKFMRFFYIKNKKVLQTKLCQKPCGRKPKTYIVTVEGGEKYFVKGPLKKEKVEFQLFVDKEKPKYGLKCMDICYEDEIQCLIAPAFEGKNVLPGIFAPRIVYINIFKALLFRYVYNISDTNLRNIMVNVKGCVLSVDEMTGNRVEPKDMNDLMKLLFSKNKIPRKAWTKCFLNVIVDNKEECLRECEKYYSFPQKIEIIENLLLQTC